MTKRCFSCRYHGSYTNTCDYYLITAGRRGCSVSGCTRYRKTEGRKPAVLPLTPSEFDYMQYSD